MSDDPNAAPVVANTRTGAVVADLSQSDEPIARPAHWVASLMWLWLVAVAGVIALLTSGALVLDFLSGGSPSSGSKDTVLLMFTMSFQGLVALYVTRPGGR
jgi:hypothetical protein